MKKLWLTVLAVLVMAVAVSAADLNVSVVSVTGTAEWRHPNGAWQPVRSGMALAKGDEVFTGPSGRVVLQMNTGRITVNPLSRVTIEANTQVQSAAATVLGVQLGNVRALVDHSRPGTQSITVNTPVGSAGIRGSEVDLSYSPDMGAEIEQLAGYSQVENEQGRESSNIAGQGSSISAEGELNNVLETAQADAVPTGAPEGTTADELAALATSGDPTLTGTADQNLAFGDETGLGDNAEALMDTISGNWYYDETTCQWYQYDPATGNIIFGI